MKRVNALRLSLLVALALLPAPGAWAQSKTTSAITGTVKGQDGGVVIGAAVTLASPQMIGGARSQITNAKGEFRFPEIAPGMYTIAVVMSGYKTLNREDVRLPVGITLDLHLALIPFTGQETVTVTGEPPAIDVTSPETKNVLSNEYLQNIPASQFQPSTLNLAPGINDTSAYGGASDTGVAWQIDGVDTSDPEAGSAWSFVNANIIDQVELAGLGAPAEYGGFTGVVFNSTTKSGGNEVHGVADAYYTKDYFTADNGAPPGLNPTVRKYINATINAGGPFIKDKLWWYVSGQYYNNVTNNGGPDNNEKSPRAFAKVSWQINANNNLDGWLEWDRFDVTGRGGDSITPLEATVKERAPEYVWNVAWKDVISKDTILDLTFQGWTGYYYLDPQEGYGLAGHFDSVSGTFNTNSIYYYLADRDRAQLNASLSRHVADWGGTHDFKFGMEIERSSLRTRYGYPTGSKFYDGYTGNNPHTGRTDTYSIEYTGNDYDVHGTNERVSAFVQDAWQISSRFTLNPGVRLDYIQGSVPKLGKVYDFLAPAPRLGFAWNITGDNQNLVKFHVGRYFAGAHTTYYDWVDPGAFKPGRTFIDWGAGQRDALTPLEHNFAIDPHLKHPYMDQYVLGYDRALPRGIVLSATLVYRNWKNFVETVAQNPDYTPVTGEIGVQDGAGNFVSTGQTVTMVDWNNFATDPLLITNPKGLKRNYKALMLSATKNFRNNWQLLASYVYSKARGTIDNTGFVENQKIGGTDSGPSRFLDTPNSMINWEGPVTYDPTHQVKLQGTYVIPRANVWLSANWTFHTGYTYTKQSQCLLRDEDNDPLTPPVCHDFPQSAIAKVRFFAEPRGSRRLPSYNQLDARVEWRPRIGQGQFGVIVDAFNVLNHGQIQSVQERDAGDFGDVRTFNTGRNLRFGVRYNF